MLSKNLHDLRIVLTVLQATEFETRLTNLREARIYGPVIMSLAPPMVSNHCSSTAF